MCLFVRMARSPRTPAMKSSTRVSVRRLFRVIVFACLDCIRGCLHTINTRVRGLVIVSSYKADRFYQWSALLYCPITPL